MGTYTVGYGKPPQASRFKKGISGNPKGRPKGSKNLKTDLEEELQSTITVTEGGRKSNVTRQRALIKALLAKGLSGDIRATSVLVSLMLKVIDPQAPTAGETGISADDARILKHFLARHGVNTAGGDDHE